MKNILKKTLCTALAFAMILGGGALAQNVGDKIGEVLSTDIVTYIEGIKVPSFNIAGRTAIVVENLNAMGLPFGVQYDDSTRTLTISESDIFGKEQKKKKPEETEEQKKEQRIRRLERQIQSWIERAEITLIQYLIYLEEWEKEYRPAGPENDPHPLFCEAMSRKSIVRYQLDTLLYGTDEDRLDFSRRKERR